ncbi:cellulose biosynthesis cyclic di-GMP-binding regulatory protein BcsB [Mucilaginibacter aquaedulcis]|uniref:cellulose biosynthesis cyclic di-GMP-binding regulatory protein BcsB n=1 Tax=Mucilaginibacter aquaedulcis TaxID=1187081 RepID=UPI0025B2B87F|nr:cellulose biosynthesis cyclic di-GMP-binding regulatory protein BcsB [Mucilaginibacter aquaedulcis]MDN3551467.1 cellulose biosynthesis cyclic di-GMP-binding regulatory protein BcsB [Mucilaginibacter aquaedulcis]
MNRFLSLLIFVFFSFTAASAQNIITLKSLGHEDDVIYGISGANSFSVKVTPLTDMKGSKLVLYFEPSQALVKQRSFINVLINNKPVFSNRLTKDSIQKLTLNLSPADLPADKLLKIQVKTLLTISDDDFKDLNNPALWLKIKNYSYLWLPKNNSLSADKINISNCFDSKRAIVYPSNPTLHDLKAVAWSYSRLKKQQVQNIQVYEEGKLPDSIQNYIQVGNINSLPATKRKLLKVDLKTTQGLFYLHKTLNEDSITHRAVTYNDPGSIKIVKQPDATQKEILFITGNGDDGYEKAISTLGNMNILNSSFGDYLLIEKAETSFFKNNEAPATKLSLKQMGGIGDFLSGIGSLKSTYTFKNSDFNFTPKEIEIHFTANYSALSIADRGFFNIYLNGLLISSEKLDATGKLNSSITINRFQRRKYNTLEAEFRFFPSAGRSRDNFYNFFAQVDIDKSYLEPKNAYVTGNLSFYQYPEAFNTGSTLIAISRDYSKFTAAALGEIIYELNNNINTKNFPEFIYADEIKPADLKKYNIIALLSKTDKLLNEFPDAPINFKKNFRLYNTDNNVPIYSLSDTVSSGLAQIFYGRSNNATLVFTATGKHIPEAFSAASKAVTEQLSVLSSNICLADVNTNTYLFNVNKPGDNFEYTDTQSGLNIFWENYNLYILLAILTLILLSFLYVRSKVQKSQEFLND